MKNSVDVSDIFYFFCSGGQKGEFEAPGAAGGDDFLLKIPGGGGSPGRVGVAGRGAGELGGGAKYFFSGPKFPPRECGEVFGDRF